MRQLTIQTLCTNRDLVLQVPFGAGATDFTLDITAPVKSIRTVNGRAVRAPLADGAIAWRTINHLSLNYLSLGRHHGRTGGRGGATASSCMPPSAHLAERRQVEAVRTMQVRP